MKLLRIKGIQRKILLSFSALIFSIIVVLLAVAYLLTQNSVNSINRDYAMILLNQKNEKLSNMITEIDIFSKAVISNRDMQKALRGEAGGSPISMTAIYSEMSNVPTKIVAGAIVVGNNGDVYREIEADVGNSIFLLMEDIVKAVGNSDGELVYIGSAYIDFGGNYGDTFIYVARKIKDITNFQDRGFMVIAVRESALWNNFGVKGEIGSYYIIDPQGIVVSAGDKSMLSQGIESVLGIKSLHDDGSRLAMGYIINQRENPACGLKIVNKIPVSALYANYYDILGAILVIGIVALLLSIYISFAIASHITSPIRQLTINMKNVAAGDLNTKIVFPEHTSEEILELNSVFSQMLSSLDEMMERIQVESVKEKDAELRALRAQINPHFLYNTLDTVYWMLIERGEYDVAELVTRIGDLLRYSIRKSSQKVALKDEIQQMENYLLIEKARYEDKLSYRFDIAPEVKSSLILSFTLQPLIENAINHGIMSQKGRGKICVRGYLKEEDLLLEIEDDGIGMSKEAVEFALSPNSEQPDMGHIGLRNVNQRIRQIFGERYGLEIISKENEGTVVIVKFPNLTV